VLQGKNVPGITERALKYDLTIPFARYVAMNQGQLVFPFKRYQVQPVWRADRPQKGRYREFCQCDADVVGSNSLLNEVELACIYGMVFTQLNMPDFRVQINNRKVLKGIMEVCGVEKKEKEILVIIDKTDKIGMEGVKDELKKQDIASENLAKLLEVYSYKGNNGETLSFLKKFLSGSTNGIQGVADMEFVLRYIEDAATSTPLLKGLKSKTRIDLTLARGLEYYTGIIFEVKGPDKVKIGSLGGGGRYDDLTGLFGVPGIPGVGISFGVDRIYDVLEELNVFPATVHTGTQVLFFNLGEEESKIAFGLMQQLREKGTRSELYHETVKFDRQFKYAEKKNIPFVIIIGEKEMKEKTCTIKNLGNGQQQTIPVTDLINFAFQPERL
jgi:histidyl-tRNA synthetase